jgi:hypothetical protein
MNPYPKPIKQEKVTTCKIRIRSQKRAKQEREYAKKGKAFLKVNKVCQVMECKRPSTQIHHKKGRIGDLLTNEEYFLAVCADCHTKIENHPEWAKEQGYSLSRLTK